MNFHKHYNQCSNKTGFKTAARQVQEYALRSFFSDDEHVCCVAVCFFASFFAAFLAAFLADFFGPAFWRAFLSTQYKSRTILSMQHKSLLHIFGGWGGVKVFLRTACCCKKCIYVTSFNNAFLSMRVVQLWRKVIDYFIEEMSINFHQSTILRCNFSLLKKKKKPWFLHFFKCDNVFKHFLQHMKTRVLPLLWSIYLWKKVVKHGTHALAMHDGQSQCCHLTFISLFARYIVVWPFGYFLVFLNVKEIVHFKVVMEKSE